MTPLYETVQHFLASGPGQAHSLTMVGVGSAELGLAPLGTSEGGHGGRKQRLSPAPSSIVQAVAKGTGGLRT